MRKNFNIITSLTLTILALGVPLYAYAATTPTHNPLPTTPSSTNAPSTSPTSESLEQKLGKQIENLKDKVASRVAELNLVEKRGIIGVVTDASNTQLTITDLNGNTQFVDVDEITKFSSPSAKASFGISDLTKGTNISVLGTYNKQSKRILARFVDVVDNPVFVSGTISDLDSKNFFITLTTEDNKPQKIDIQTVSKIQTYDATNGIIKYGFSKLQIGDRAFVTGFTEKVDKTLILASRVLIVPNLPKDPKIVLQSQTPSTEPSTTPGITPSTGSGKKLTPIIKK